jgi:ABC-type sugar transport system ATPase subunit
MTDAPLISMRGTTKRFPGVLALDGVDFEVRAGEVMALVGENGAGKSTLLKILAGAYSTDMGEVRVDGEVVSIETPKASQQHGIAVIHQELNLAEHLSVAENIFVGREPLTRLRTVDFRRMQRESREVLAELGVDIDPAALVSSLNLARKQMVEIAKALSLRSRVVVMDEPTSPLTEDEVVVLLDLVRRLRSRGVAVVYVSHRFREVFAVADRITVMRDGKLACDVLRTSETTPDAVVSLMVGRELTAIFGERHRQPRRAQPVVSVRGLAVAPRVKDVTFDLYPGEVLGVAGLVGAGRSEVARAIFAVDRRSAGEVLVDGEPVHWAGPRDAIRAGIGFVPEDRKAQGLFLGMPVPANVAAASPGLISRRGLLHRGRERRLAQEHCRELRLRESALEVAVGTLSGGNQQKVVLARWLALRPRVLLLDEPTRGVDIGAKAEIYRLIRQIATQGVAVLMISSELPEVLGMSDRVVVLREGRVAGELSADDADERSVMALATGVVADDETGRVA